MTMTMMVIMTIKMALMMVLTTLMIVMMVIMMSLCDDENNDDYDNVDLDYLFAHKYFTTTSNYYDLKHNIPTKQYEYLHNPFTTLQHHQMHGMPLAY
jgi:hypothetical protein